MSFLLGNHASAAVPRVESVWRTVVRLVLVMQNDGSEMR